MSGRQILCLAIPAILLGVFCGLAGFPWWAGYVLGGAYGLAFGLYHFFGIGRRWQS